MGKVKGVISKISGPVVVAKNMRGASMYEVTYVGEQRLLGEVIQLKGGRATIQVYENTSMLKPGQPVESAGRPLSILLGPGLLANIYDGIARPLKGLAKHSGDFIARGISLPSIDLDAGYEFVAGVKKGQEVKEGQVLGEVQETEIVKHRIIVPVGIKGKVIEIHEGKHRVNECVVEIKDSGKNHKVSMAQEWPIRRARPYAKKLMPDIPLITGQRIFDTLFPLAKGGTAAIPGPFGSGKTVMQQSLAKWSDADVIVYIGCGERGNEMTEVLTEFPELEDPRTGRPLMERTILIANTSNMPVAAREASIYTGITLAEYYRDQGYDVALMADSTSRWAEAMREISSRLEEMPGEEGYPAYLATKLAQFYERAGRVKTLAGTEGSVTVIGAVSPPGGDFSEPVTQNTLRITKVFWALDAQLAYKRHFPAINWLTSYSLYKDVLERYFREHIAESFVDNREKAMVILQKEAELQEIVQLVGADALPEKEKLVLYTARSLREDFLQQNAFHEVDAYCPLEKQHVILDVILRIHALASEAIAAGVKVAEIQKLPYNDEVARLKEKKDFKQQAERVLKQAEEQIRSLKRPMTAAATKEVEA
jgi:V/A-type H+-transporting ATPase subunit A